MKKEHGFSYLELILVVAIILILAGLSGSFYSRFLTQNSVANIQDQLANQMRKAQIYSMMSRQNNSWGVKFGAGKITLFRTGSNSFDENFAVNSNVSLSGFTTITFAKVTGLPDSTPTITISGNNQTKSVTINSQGVVSK